MILSNKKAEESYLIIIEWIENCAKDELFNKLSIRINNSYLNEFDQPFF